MGTAMTDHLGEKLVLVAGNSCDLWLLVHRADSTKFLSYNITSSGISAPIVSNTGTFTGTDCYTIGMIKPSPDRRKVVCQVYNVGSAMGTELYDFDATTGILSNCRVLESARSEYGAEFSPNSQLLYCQEWGTVIDQYDVTGATAAAIIATRVTVVSTPTESDLKLAPDGKIYVNTSFGSGTIDCIPNPNTAGTGCGYTSPAVTLSSSTSANYGMPNMFIASLSGGDTSIKVFDTAVCFPPGGFLINADTTGTAYLWNLGSTASSFNVTGIGNYWVAINNGCRINIDSFHITSLPMDTLTHSRDTSICSTVGSFTLTAPSGYANYLWSTGVSATSISVSAAGPVYVYAGTGCHILIDTVNVNIIPFVHTDGISDSSFCFPGSFTLNALGGYAAYLWQDGTTNANDVITAPGTYYVVSSAYCKDRVDTFHTTDATFTFNLGPDVTVCMNYPIEAPITGPGVSYRWQDGSIGSSYSASRTGNYALTITKGNCKAEDTINVTFFHFSQNIRDTFICKGVPINLDLVANPPAGGKVLWNDGTTNPVRTVHDSGTYWVYVSKDECEILDTVHVVTGFCTCWHNVPSAFTPNADGLNDIVKPAIQPGCNVSGYQFSIFNRWGEQVFTSDIPGKGWDGTYKGEPADMGVYMYSLQFFTGVYDKQSAESGSITLIR
jgi:gliding motility-associated-like protein